jgi:molecular chaperone GrpE
MADSDKPAGKGHFEAEVGDDLIKAALESVERRQEKAQIPVEVTVELKEVKATLELSAERAKETLDRLKETHDRQLRAVADLDNYKKRAARERGEVEKFAIEKLIKELLPVLDNFDRALEHAASAGGDALVQGVAATRKLFEDTLGKFGVKAFSAKGQAFDPTRHEAVQRVETNDVPPNSVAQEVVRGYHLHERLLRPAIVVVATAPAAAEPAKETAEESSEAKGGGT